MSFGCDANAVVLVIEGYRISIAKYLRGVSTSYKFERNRSNIFRVKSVDVFGSKGRGGGRGGDAKTIISPNTPSGDIMICRWYYINILVQQKL